MNNSTPTYIQDNAKNIDNAKMGLLTKIWGPPMWESLHSITFGYPIDPTENDKIHYKIFFESLAFVLPCCLCSESYTKFIKTGESSATFDNTVITDDVFADRTSITRWFFNIHNAVNSKLGVTYEMTYELLCKKYESYRATCDMTPHDKIKGYINADSKEVPHVAYDTAMVFNDYAKKRGFKNFDKKILKTSKLVRDTPEWDQRNNEVWKIIKWMRQNGITGIERVSSKEQTNKYVGYLSYCELLLIERMATSLSKKEIEQAIIKLRLI